MPGYVRPPIETATFRDVDGAVIDYGERWEELGGHPPEDSYSVDSNTERFAPLHTVAEALIEYLAATYDVTVDEGFAVASASQHAPDPEDVVRAVRLTPARTAAAPLTFVLTSYPSVILDAGVLCSFAHPSCGCDACDETWEDAADDLEWQVLAVAGGGLKEYVSEPRRAKLRYQRGMGLVRDMGQPSGTGSRRSTAVGAKGASRGRRIFRRPS